MTTDDHAARWLDARAHLDALAATLDRAGDDEAFVRWLQTRLARLRADCQLRERETREEAA